MKIALFLQVFLFIPIFSNAQMDSTDRKVDENIVYDSLYNFPEEKIYAMKGQILYVCPDEKQKDFGYTFFYEKPISKSLHYKSKKKYENTPYESVSGKYFLVKDIIKVEKGYLDYGSMYINDDFVYYYELESVEKPNDIFYFKYTTSKDMYPFICRGYYEKMRTYIGRKIKTYDKEYDCVDVTINPESKKIDFHLKDSLGNVIVYSNEKRSLRNNSNTIMNNSGTVYVKGYYRKDGTYVRPHTRRK